MNLSSYTYPIGMACLLFPFIALIFTAPFLIYEYRKYGAVPILKGIIIYSFILYLMSAFFLVILPMPSIKEVTQMTGPRAQLNPFQFILDLKKDGGLVITNPHTYLKFLKSFVFLQLVFNIVLTMPFGIYMRYYYRKRFLTTTILTFCLSLFFELTQLSGLYFIYPRGYRLFDVDDLLMNTIGGIVGYLICPLICFFLPTRDEIDKNAFKKGQNVTMLRRFVAYCFDFFVYILIAAVTIRLSTFESNNSSLFLCVSLFIYFTIVTILFKGKTLGKKIVKSKLVRFDGSEIRNIDIWYGMLFCILLFYQCQTT